MCPDASRAPLSPSARPRAAPPPPPNSIDGTSLLLQQQQWSIDVVKRSAPHGLLRITSRYLNSGSGLHATAVRVIGDNLQRLARAGEHALAAGLELWFSPVPINLEPSALPGYFARCADEAERLRRAHEGRVVLVLGCEISLWCAGFLPGGDSVSSRISSARSPPPTPAPGHASHCRARLAGLAFAAGGSWVLANRLAGCAVS